MGVRIASHRRAERVAVHARHLEVTHHGVRHPLVQPTERFGAIGCLTDVGTCASQDADEQLADGRIVVDNQYERRRDSVHTAHGMSRRPIQAVSNWTHLRRLVDRSSAVHYRTDTAGRKRDDPDRDWKVLPLADEPGTPAVAEGVGRRL